MCGIFGYVGPQDALEISLAGLKKLEYRGYDSSGLAGLLEGKLITIKESGKIARMEENARASGIALDLAIAHTRWATHGEPTQRNAHPHCDEAETLALVHNGIIENYESLRKTLIEEGVSFRSDTDSEVVAQLIAYYYKGDILQTVQQVMPLLQGALAIALVHKDHPDQIVVAARESPLVVGLGNGEAFISSDPNAFVIHTQKVCYIHDSEVAVVRADSLEVYDETMAQVKKKTERIEAEGREISKQGFEHYMLKEIYEQPQVIRNALLSRFSEEQGDAVLDGLKLSKAELLNVDRILILACGTSWNAGYIASYMLEDIARIPTQVEISSEFRYKNPIVAENTLVIAISQSGETADTIAAVREAKSKGAKVIAICNVLGSTLARETENCLLLRAGVEVSVCSTKAFVSQLIVLALFTLHMARMRHLGKAAGQKFLQALRKLPDQVQFVLSRAAEIERLAKKYSCYEQFMFLGRHQMYPCALEAALKLKEISYINAVGYPAGEMKHGPIALIDEKMPSMAFCANKLTFEKLLSNLSEVKARKGVIFAIAAEGAMEVLSVVDDVFWIPKTLDELAAIPSSVVGQLFAYYVAKARGTEIDQPRNLAKSVTVE